AVALQGIVAGDVLRLGEVERAGVLRRVNVGGGDLDALVVDGVRAADGSVGKREDSGRGIDLGPLAERAAAVEAGNVGVRAADAELVAAEGRRRAAAAAAGAVASPGVGVGRQEAVLQPAHADLLEATALQPVEVLGDDRVVLGAGARRAAARLVAP